MTHLQKYDILTNKQHGFRARFSCVSQLVTTTSDLFRSHDDNRQTDMVILDFSKAFDVVSHRKLLAKLQHQGINGQVGNWISSFLSARTQQVVIDGVKSNPAPVLSGVPQGTCLGPILFLCYINDIVCNIRSTIRLFADDTLLYREIRTQEDHHTLQQDLEILESWARKWDMSFNPKKCYVLSTGRKTPSTYMYTLCNVVLKSVEHNPYLGVTLSSDLSFSTHIDNITAKASRTLGFLARNLRGCPERLRALSYTTLCRPNLEYAAAIWDPPPNSSEAGSIEKVQRRAARYTTNNYKRTSSVNNMLRRLEWEPLTSRRKNIRLTTLFQILHQQLGPPDELPICQGRRGRLKACATKYKPFHQSFVPNTIRDWNALPQNTREADELEAFRAGLPKATY